MVVLLSAVQFNAGVLKGKGACREVTVDVGLSLHVYGQYLMYWTSSQGYICLLWCTENKCIHVLPV